MRTLFAVLLLAGTLTAQGHPITHEDVWLMKRVGAPAVSPDGKWVITGVSQPSYEAGKTVSDLWIVPVDGSAPPRRLTNTAAPESDVVFSPDSTRIAFATKREGDETTQIYILPLNGGEATRVTTLSTGASNPQFRPDGQAILFESSVYPGAMNDEDNRRIAAERKGHKYNMRVFDSFPIRYWDHWVDDLRPHIFVQTLAEGERARDLLAGTRLIAEAGFEGDFGSTGTSLDALWTPDGSEIVFTATKDLNHSVSGPSSVELYRVSARGGEPEALTAGPDSYSSPIFRPDGKALYAMHSRSEAEALYSLNRLVKLDWPRPSGKPKPVTSGWDRSVASVAFSPDSRTVYLTAEDQGHDRIFSAPADGGAVRQVSTGNEGVYTGLVIPERAAKTILIALWGSMVHPEDVARIDTEKGDRHLLSDFNHDRIAQIDWQPPREFWITTKSGRKVQSLIVLPPAFDPAKKYPLVVFPHGGPHNMIKDQFFVRWNYHLLASPGYVMLMPNYTGSTGYGEEFAAAIHKDILRTPAAEIEQAADEAIRQFAYIDGSRQAAIGASYGGYLMAWFEGNTKRFKCLVDHAGLTDNSSFYGATDGAFYWESRNGGPVWERKGAWQEQSPAAYAANFSTPMLITHGEQDFRVPINQAFEMYKLLQRRSVPTRLVIFPDASHWVLKGEDARQHMREVLDWIKKYI